METIKKILITTIILITCLLAITLLYFAFYYHASDTVNSYLKENDTIKVTEAKEYYYFDGPGEDSALIFYPGAKVEPTSYSILMHKLASNNIDCFILKMPLNFALLGSNKAEAILTNYKYSTWLLSGHSLGGVVASSFATKHHDKINYLVLLASYPTQKIDDSIKLLSIYGDQDGILNIEKYNNSKKFWPRSNNEIIISGANHANYANYGHQRGDKEATISNDEQQNQVVEQIKYFIEQNK